MLDPDTRAVLLDSLRPPPGMVLGHAVGTTFTLDLETLLLAPLAFAWFDTAVADDGVPADPIALLEAVRRHAKSIDVFCQAGRIRVPPKDRPLLALLEDSVHPVQQPQPGRIFHPKTWVIRYREPESGETSLRVLVLSRNLTFDRSWDVIVRLDEGDGEGNAEDLAHLLRWLPAHVVSPMTDVTRNALDRLATELTLTTFDEPIPFSGAEVNVLGTGLDPLSPISQRILVVSPFVSDATLQRWAENASKALLVSTKESIDRLQSETLDTLDEVYVLDPNAAGGETITAPGHELSAARNDIGLTGLHAKIVVSEWGRDAHSPSRRDRTRRL